MTDRVTTSVADGVADVRLNRPDKMNALDPAMFDGIVEAIDRLGAMREVRCVVLSGEGRAFCAGLDMASMAAGGSGLDIAERSWGETLKALKALYILFFLIKLKTLEAI